MPTTRLPFAKVPADVEQMVSRLQQPHNPAVERTVGSHSLAAAAHRERSAAAAVRVGASMCAALPVVVVASRHG